MTSEGGSNLTGFFKEYTEDAKSSHCPDVEVGELLTKVKQMDRLLHHTFTAVSTLKSSYIQMQHAHSPYDRERLRVADKSVVLELKKLSLLNHTYKSKNWIGIEVNRDCPNESDEKHNHCAYENVSCLKLELQRKNMEIQHLKDTVQKLVFTKEKLEHRIRKLDRWNMRGSGTERSREPLSPTVSLFESAVHAANEAGRAFTKLLINHMKAASWDLDAAVMSIEPGISYAKQTHKKYAFQSYVCLRMFNGFEHENFYITGSLSSILDPAKHRDDCFHQFEDMQCIDPLDLLRITPDCLFGKFCHKKYLYIVHPKMEESFFGNSEHRNQILSGSHPYSPFYRVFLQFCKSVWLLHNLAFAFHPVAKIFQVRKGADYFSACMESLVQDVVMEHETPNLLPKVGFTVMPGFRLGKTTIKCQVYLNGMVPSE
eukprot:c17725_g1_i1 orf=217-1500(-)